jgi:hypothetical protein
MGYIASTKNVLFYSRVIHGRIIYYVHDNQTNMTYSSFNKEDARKMFSNWSYVDESLSEVSEE